MVIRLAVQNDFQNLRQFIREEWGAKHPLATNTDLFDWQYKNGCSYNIYVAEDQSNNSIVGFLGFIPNTRYDNNISNDSFCVWWSLWKILDHYASQGLGLRLMLKAVAELNAVHIGVVGINDEVEKIYSKLSYTTGVMDHFYQINSKAKNYSLLSSYISPNKNIENYCNSVSIRSIDGNNRNYFRQLKLDVKSLFGTKTPLYLANRYTEHPFYSYELFEILLNRTVVALFVTRVASGAGGRALRIVDYLGDDRVIANIGGQINKLVENRNCEYVDFVCKGFDKNSLFAAGFHELYHEGDFIIPNHFEPLVQANVKLRFAIKVKENEEFRLVKGDGDQDRGNYCI